jgi:hypothetical protein
MHDFRDFGMLQVALAMILIQCGFDALPSFTVLFVSG